MSYYGELLNDAALESAVRIPLVDWADTECAGGVLVGDTSDFYLGFMVTGSFTSDGLDRFGWCHVSMDENMRMSLLDVGIGFNGEPVIVGIGPIPEPSTGMLLLVGLAFVGLSRRMRGGTWGASSSRSRFDCLFNTIHEQCAIISAGNERMCPIGNENL